MPRETVTYQREKLYVELWNEPSSVVAKRYGISNEALCKTCKKLDVPKPPRGYWARRAVGKLDPITPLPKAKGAAAMTVVRPGRRPNRERTEEALEQGRAAMGPPILVVLRLVFLCNDHVERRPRHRHLIGDREPVTMKSYRHRCAELVEPSHVLEGLSLPLAACHGINLATDVEHVLEFFMQLGRHVLNVIVRPQALEEHAHRVGKRPKIGTRGQTCHYKRRVCRRDLFLLLGQELGGQSIARDGEALGEKFGRVEA